MRLRESCQDNNGKGGCRGQGRLEVSIKEGIKKKSGRASKGPRCPRATKA